MPSTTDSLLREIVARFKEERVSLETQHRAIIEDLTHREEMVLKALNGSTGSTRPTPSRKRKDRTQYRYSISPEKEAAVLEYLRKHPKGARQSDVVRGTGLNSGSVSVALAKAKKANKARLQGRKDNSNFWLVSDNGNASQNGNGARKKGSRKRETVVAPGVGVHEGRLAAASG